MTEVHLGPALARALAGRDPFDALASAGGTTFREVDGRRTSLLELGDLRCFAKVHGGTGLGEVLKNLASLRLPVLDARAEVRALEHLRAAGVAVPEVLGWGVRGVLPHRRRSFVVTRDVGTQRTLADVARELPPRAHRERRAWIRATGRLVAAMHGAGVNHRDCYLVHLLCPEAPGEPRPVLLDLHRAQVRARVPLRWRAKDLGGLAFSSGSAPLTRTDRLRFVRAYAGTRAKDALRRDARLWAAVEARRAGLVAEEARRGERFGR